ncbi:hypothetical protein SAMN05421548_101476 [Paraburkholderia lycopersici]|uniref:Uncharacterized protein n=1 Tax=Paraburkholderia lycopersici TaxID=416944 RepID=A0A1G6GZA8_9BURK|nr:hypothetical protein SAMN05421548_101476 [Paraburkholderia lycopersici]
MDIGGAHSRVGGHRNRAPYTSATVAHFLLQLGLCRGIALVFRCDVFKGWPNQLAIHGMASHARIGLSHRHPIRNGSKNRRSEPTDRQPRQDPSNKTQHHNAPVFPDRVAEELVTGAGA